MLHKHKYTHNYILSAMSKTISSVQICPIRFVSFRIAMRTESETIYWSFSSTLTDSRSYSSLFFFSTELFSWNFYLAFTFKSRKKHQSLQSQYEFELLKLASGLYLSELIAFLFSIISDAVRSQKTHQMKRKIRRNYNIFGTW